MDFICCLRPYHSCRGISVLPAFGISTRLPAANRFLPTTSLRLTTPFLQYPKFSIETYAKKKKKKNTKTTIFEPKPNKEDESLIEEEEEKDEEEEQVLLEDVLDGALRSNNNLKIPFL